jgi:type II secretory pathway predicted ATPase ExeA
MSTYLEHFQLSQPPFSQEPDSGIFYPGASRREVLQSLLDDIQSRQSLIKLTGGEGVGKTLLYLLLIQRLSPETYDIVNLDHPVGSFGDLLRIICVALGYDEARDETAPGGYIEVFREQLQLRKDKQRRVLLIIDEAEKLFLATLERLVKTICDTDEADVLQILLVGRRDLDTSLDQLTIYCSNVDIYAGHVLEPLNFEETREYLQFRLHSAGIPGAKYQALFTDDAVYAIWQVAEGNISQTNILAEKGLKTACDEGMFRVEPDFIGIHPAGKKNAPPLLSNISRSTASWYDQFMGSQVGALLKKHKWWSIAAALLLVLLLIMAWPGDEDDAQAPDTGSQAALEQVKVEEKEVEQPEARENSPPVTETEAVAEGEPAEVEPAVPEVSVQPEEESGFGEAKTIVLEAEFKKKKGRVSPVKEEPKAEPSSRDGAALFRERMRASSNWLAWAYRGGYTIQLMRLTSGNAEDNLKQILVEDEYYAVRDNLFILRGSTPPALFIFYGMYDTMEQARQARNNMPIFLRRHHPYALSIKEALKKTDE